MRLESPLAAALNRLLETERWAAARLAPFAGRSVELRAPPLPSLRLALGEAGRVAPAPLDGEASVVLHWRLGEGAPEGSGDPVLAAELLALARELRWDFEEELARVVGDVAAHRMAQAARAFAAWPVEAARRVADGAAEFTAAGGGPAVTRAELARPDAELAELSERLARLAARIERLER